MRQNLTVVKTILLFGAGKSATVLIDYLIQECETQKWKLIIADANKEQILLKTNHAKVAEAVEIDIKDEDSRSQLIQRAHVVISMMPPALHYLVAKDCVEYRKHLLTASYVDQQIKSLSDEINHRKLLFLCEMGLDPGIDHMSALQLIDQLKAEGKTITSFKSHCGGLVAPESDDNPWHYKISWNPRNVVLAGKAGAEFLLNGEAQNKDYPALFKDCEEVQVAGLPSLATYPNRDSLSYIPIYKLQSATTFIRTTLRYPAFCTAWQGIIEAKLTDETSLIPENSTISFKDWSKSLLPFVNSSNQAMYQFLGLFDTTSIPAHCKNNADVLQYLLETKLVMQPEDKDMIVMLHEIEYNGGSIKSSLVVKGENSLRTAMAKTVGLPLGIAAKLILTDQLKIKGLHIPIQKEIYEPVLKELALQGICFEETRTQND